MSEERVVIIGGGFAGLHAARELTSAGIEVTIIDRHAYTTFQPLLYQVATGGLNPGDVTYSLRRWASNDRSHLLSFRRATVTGIDHQNKQVIVSRGMPIKYGKLVVCPGVGANFFGIPGAEDYSKQIYTRGQALEVRDIIFSGLELMAAERDPNRRFCAVVVGGGPTGVEMAGALAEMKTQALPVLYPEIGVDNFHVVLVEMTDRLLGPFDRKLQRYTKRSLQRLGVDVRLNTAVKEVFPDRVDFADGSRLDCDIVIWASGVGAHPLVSDWGLPQGRGGRVLVQRDLQVEGLPDIYAAGDGALCNDDPQPQLAQPAIQMGNLVAKNIVADLRGGQREQFVYNDKGTMATIGRNAAVVQIPNGPKMMGFPAWLMWVVVHLATLLGGRNRVSALINIGVRYASWPKSAVGIIGDYVDSPARLQRGVAE